MKKSFVILIFAVYLLSSFNVVFCEEYKNNVKVNISTAKIYINETTVDNQYNKYPIIHYKNVSYIPLSEEFCEALGITLSFDSENGLEINKTIPTSKLKQSLTDAYDFSKHYEAEIVDVPLTINGKLYENRKEKHDILKFNNVYYLPLTWDIAVNQLNWYFHWGVDVDKNSVLTLQTNYYIEEDYNELDVEMLKDLDVKIDGVNIHFETKPIKAYNYILLPLDELLEALGFNVDYYKTSRSIVAEKGDFILSFAGFDLNDLKEDCKDFNKIEYYDISYFYIYKDKVYFPVEVISKTFGIDALVNNENKTIVINTSYMNLYQALLKMKDSEYLQVNVNSKEEIEFNNHKSTIHTNVKSILYYDIDSVSTIFYTIFDKDIPPYDGSMKFRSEIMENDDKYYSFIDNGQEKTWIEENIGTEEFVKYISENRGMVFYSTLFETIINNYSLTALQFYYFDDSKVMVEKSGDPKIYSIKLNKYDILKHPYLKSLELSAYHSDKFEYNVDYWVDENGYLNKIVTNVNVELNDEIKDEFKYEKYKVKEVLDFKDVTSNKDIAVTPVKKFKDEYYHNKYTDLDMNKVVTFKDSELENNIRYSISKENGPILQKDLMNIKFLRIDDRERKISNLEGIQYLLNLEKLYLMDNNIKDITQLKYLKNLKDLQLENNKIEDVSPLANLEKLESLGLARNNIKNLDCLRNNTLENLDEIDLSYNDIKDIDPLNNLKNVNSMTLNDNAISDISCLRDLVELKNLDLANNQITNINILNNMDKLIGLNLSNNNIDSIKPISNLINLKYLYLNNCNIDDNDMRYLLSVNRVIALSLSNNKLTDISGLRSFINLEYLFLSSNQIKDISPLKNLKNIRELKIDFNQVEEIGIISELPNLDLLFIHGNNIKDFSILDKLNNVEIKK